MRRGKGKWRSGDRVGQMRRGKGKWQSGERDVKDDVIPSGVEESLSARLRLTRVSGAWPVRCDLPPCPATLPANCGRQLPGQAENSTSANSASSTRFRCKNAATRRDSSFMFMIAPQTS